MPETTLEALQAASKKPMPPNPTIRDACQAVARLGGYIKNNGEPGWLVLWRGYQHLPVFQLGWDAARRFLPARCVQS